MQRPDNLLSLGGLANFPSDVDWIDRPVSNNGRGGRDEGHHRGNKMGNVTSSKIRCHNCGEVGHKSTYCQEKACDQETLIKLIGEDKEHSALNKGVICHYCQMYGHYATVCPER